MVAQRIQDKGELFLGEKKQNKKRGRENNAFNSGHYVSLAARRIATWQRKHFDLTKSIQ